MTTNQPLSASVKRKNGWNSRFSFHNQKVHLVGILEIFLEVLRIDLDFSQADYHGLFFLCCCREGEYKHCSCHY